jgi:L-alanine-DL-glutamate epimerase-like enolase superfamily enzyme
MPMKITGPKTNVAKASRKSFVFIKIYADNGIDGVGEATLEWMPKTAIASLEELERVLIGRDAIVGGLHPTAIGARGRSSARHWPRSGRQTQGRVRRGNAGTSRGMQIISPDKAQAWDN